MAWITFCPLASDALYSKTCQTADKPPGPTMFLRYIGYNVIMIDYYDIDGY